MSVSLLPMPSSSTGKLPRAPAFTTSFDPSTCTINRSAFGRVLEDSGNVALLPVMSDTSAVSTPRNPAPSWAVAEINTGPADRSAAGKLTVAPLTWAPGGSEDQVNVGVPG